MQGRGAAGGGMTRWCQRLQWWNDNQLAPINWRRRSNSATAQLRMMMAVKRGQQWRTNNCVAATDERMSDAAMEEQPMLNPWQRLSDKVRMWRRLMAANKMRHGAKKACQQMAGTVCGWGATRGWWQLSREDSSEGAIRNGVAEEEGLPHEERWQRPTTKHLTYPSGKVFTNAQHCWGRGSKPLERGSKLP